MDTASLRGILVRDLRAVKRELEAYPDEAGIWRAVPGTPNTGGTLALHIAGNVRHFFGAVLAGDGYKRDRDAEFARRGVPRPELLEGIDAAITSVERAFSRVTADVLAAEYPQEIGGRRLPAGTVLVHLAAHLAYHLGQLDYHRRAATGDSRSVDAVSVREL